MCDKLVKARSKKLIKSFDHRKEDTHFLFTLSGHSYKQKFLMNLIAFHILFSLCDPRISL